MATNSFISSTDAQGLIPQPQANEIFSAMTQKSIVLQLARRIMMSSKTLKMPVLTALPTAGFLSAEGGLKQSSKAIWEGKTLTVEEIPCIVPVPDYVFDDSAFDIWAQVTPLIVESLGIALDAAVLFGAGKPLTWPAGLVDQAVAAGNVYVQGTSAQNKGGVAEDVNQTMAKVESSGFDVNGFATSRTFRSVLRGARDTTGQKLLDVDPSGERLMGQPVSYGAEGTWPTAVSTARMLAGDWTKAIIGIRQDITVKMFTESVITNDAGEILINLMQQDMKALRVVARYAFQVANPITRNQSVEADRCPFSVLLAPGA